MVVVVGPSDVEVEVSKSEVVVVLVTTPGWVGLDVSAPPPVQAATAIPKIAVRATRFIG
jgi:hypothetical protein